MVIKILTGLEKAIMELKETSTTDNLKKKKTEVKNSEDKIENILKRMNSRLDDAEEWLSDLEDE